MKSIKTPLTKDMVRSLRAGDIITITGVIYTARDAAHKRLFESIEKGEPLPFELENQIIYYVGPTPAKEGQAIGSAGPTTSGRMDAYSPKLIEKGITGMIGKGYRNKDVTDAIRKYGAAYFAATGGAGALLSSCIESSAMVAYEDLGTEAIRKLEVVDFPVVCVIDMYGNNFYELSREKYRKN